MHRLLMTRDLYLRTDPMRHLAPDQVWEEAAAEESVHVPAKRAVASGPKHGHVGHIAVQWAAIRRNSLAPPRSLECRHEGEHDNEEAHTEQDNGDPVEGREASHNDCKPEHDTAHCEGPLDPLSIE